MKISRRQLIKLIRENTEQFMKDFEEEMTSLKELPPGTARGDDYPAQYHPDYLFKGSPREYDNQGVGRAAYVAKKLWNKYADRKWVDSLVKIHWLKSLDDFNVNTKDELSCATYTKEEYNNLNASNWSGAGAGLVLEGYTTFLGPGTSNPGFYRFMSAVPGYVDSKKSSGISRLPLLYGQNISPELEEALESGVFVYNQESWNKMKNQFGNEIVESYVDNWRISQIVYSSEKEFVNNLDSYDKFVERANEQDLLTREFITNNYRHPKILK